MRIALLSTLTICFIAPCTACDKAPADATHQAAATSETIVVNVLYRERRMLPPEARVEATLIDVSRADAKAPILSRADVPAKGGPPYRLELEYDQKKIEAGHRYALRAVIKIE